MVIIASCNTGTNEESSVNKVRQQVDTVGFAQYDWQTDSLMASTGGSHRCSCRRI